MAEGSTQNDWKTSYTNISKLITLKPNSRDILLQIGSSVERELQESFLAIQRLVIQKKLKVIAAK